MTVSKITPAQKELVKRNYEAKRMNIKQMALALDVSTRTIGRVLDEMGLAAPMAKRHGEAFQARELLKSYGVSVAQLHEILAMRKNGPVIGAVIKAMSEYPDEMYNSALKDIIHLREARKYNISVQGAMLKLERKAEANANDNEVAGS